MEATFSRVTYYFVRAPPLVDICYSLLKLLIQLTFYVFCTPQSQIYFQQSILSHPLQSFAFGFKWGRTLSFKKKDAVGHPFLFYGLTLKSGGITRSVRFLAPLFSTFVSSGFEPAIPNFSLVSPHDAIKLTANNKTKSLLIVLFLHESFVV